jgi:hypothetical protein
MSLSRSRRRSPGVGPGLQRPPRATESGHEHRPCRVPVVTAPLDREGDARVPHVPHHEFRDGLAHAAAIAALSRRLAARAQAHRAVLELRDLRVRVQRRIGEPVDRRLVVGKGHEHRAPRRALVGTRVQAHRPAARLDGQQPARRHAQGLQVQRVDQRGRVGLDRVEHAGAPGHAAGVPVLELAAGDQHHRVLGIGALVGGQDVGRHEARPAVLAREVVGEDHRLAGVALVPAGVDDRMLALQPLPGDAGDAGHQPRISSNTSPASAAVAPGQAQAACRSAG